MEEDKKNSIPLKGSLSHEIACLPGEIQNNIALISKELIQETIDKVNENSMKLQFLFKGDEKRLPKALEEFWADIKENVKGATYLNYLFKRCLGQEFIFAYFEKNRNDQCQNQVRSSSFYEEYNIKTIEEWIHVVEEWKGIPKMGFLFDFYPMDVDDCIKTRCKSVLDSIESKFKTLQLGKQLFLYPRIYMKISNVIECLQDPYFRGFSVTLRPDPYWTKEDMDLLKSCNNLKELKFPWNTYAFKGEGIKNLTQLRSIKFGHLYQDYFNGSLKLLTNLHTLKLGYSVDKKTKSNDMSNEELLPLINLTSLDLSKNCKVSYGGISHLTNLTWLDLGTAWNKEDTGRIKNIEVAQLKAKLPNLNIQAMKEKI